MRSNFGSQVAYSCNKATCRPIEEVVRANNIHQRNVYETCFKYQGTVVEVDALANTLPGKAETNGNLFIGLYEDLIRFFD